ncbi:hypothetical protein D9757_006712 [Collybiopsis confluens]|uniref:Uncharacterized protein n=1 Tax=Collybiopsis confluens TaxID=2823264 RepID=A0A8H5HN39_9AGAR|nr:hypothetical protein D9757_006712 [Collybiopsis confluens]
MVVSKRYSYSSASSGSSYPSTATFVSESTVVANTTVTPSQRFGPTVIKWRLAYIETALNHRFLSGIATGLLRPFYSNLIDFFRHGHDQSIRAVAFRLIMGTVGRMDVGGLAVAVVNRPVPQSFDLIEAMLNCLRRLIDSDTHITKKEGLEEAYLSEALDAYKAKLPPNYPVFTPFILFLCLITTSSSDPSFARMLTELNIFDFITDTHPAILNYSVKFSWPTTLLPVKYLLQALLQKLDPAKDNIDVVRLYRLLHVTTESTKNIQVLARLAVTALPPSELLESIQSTIDKMNSQSDAARKCHLLYPGEVELSDGETFPGNDEINLLLQKERMLKADEVQVVFVGVGNSGQAKIKEIHHLAKLSSNNGYSQQEREVYKREIYARLIHSMIDVIHDMPSMNLNVTAENEAHRAFMYSLPSNLKTDTVTPDILEAIRSLGKDPAIMEAVRRSNQISHKESILYFLDSVPRLCSPEYLPAAQDILQQRQSNPAATETIIQTHGTFVYKLYDVGNVGSQTSQSRQSLKKRLHCFDSATALVFVVNVSEYDQFLDDDDYVNCLHDAMNTFEEICNSRWLINTPVILYLSGTDVLTEKLARSPLSDYFPDYTGRNNDYDSACEYLLHRFVALNREPKRLVYAHYIPQLGANYSDITKLEFFFAALQDILLQSWVLKLTSPHIGYGRRSRTSSTSTERRILETTPAGPFAY